MSIDPNTVLSNAIYMGLVALVRLARNRTSKKTRRYYNSIEKMWFNACNKYQNQNPRYPDLSPIQNAEPNMRGRFLKFVWASTRRFGNREFKRVYSWLEGSVGTLNALLNFAGARLRDLAMTMYPFPEPEKFEVREYADGSKRILSPKETENSKKDNAIKTYYKFGYERKRKLPRVFLSHPILSGLDFVDMIRAHCVELCRQCFIYDVPMLEAHRYIRLLIHRLKPFLDWVYTGGTKGRNNFNPDADKVLRSIVLEIRTLYRKRSKTRKRVSHRNAATLEPTIELVRDKVEADLETITDEDAKEPFQKILDHIDNEDIAVRDIEKLVDLILALNSREGNEWHRILMSDLHHPVSLKQVVYFGDKLLDEPSSILIVAELPVAKHSGKVDLTVFIRRKFSVKPIWTPVMVIEIKTKTGFDFNLFGMKIKRTRTHTVTPAFYAWKRMLSDDEWDALATSGPDETALDQLKAYNHAILAEYNQIAPHDPEPPTSLWKGVIVLDTDQEPTEVFSAFQFLLDDLTTGLHHQLLGKDTLSVIPEALDSGEASPRVSLLIAPTSGPVELLDKVVPATSIHDEDPFAEREPDDRTLTLYVPVDSPTSSGKTAARISTNWHLLHHIQECIATSSDQTEVFWLDLMGDFGSKELVAKRFGIERLFQEKKISKNSFQQLTSTLQDIRFINLNSFITQLFNNRTRAIDRLSKHLQFLFPSDVKRKRIIILDGWAELKEMIPKHQQSLLMALEYQFLETLPHSEVDIIWIDSGINHTRMNRSYQRKCIKPLRHNSPRITYLDEVIYNVPTNPWIFGWTTPQREDVRIIIQDVDAKVPPWKVPIQVPQLFGFAEKFRGMSTRKRTYSEEEVERYTADIQTMHGKNVSLSSIYAPIGRLPEGAFTKIMDDALTLIPSVFRDREIQHKNEEEVEEEEIDECEEEEDVPAAKWESDVQPATSLYGPSLKKRMHLAVARLPPVPVRGKPQYTVAEKITRPWHYERTPVQFYEDLDKQYVSTAPPVVKELLGGLIDTLETRERELRRIQYAVKYLNDQTFVSQNLRGICRKIERFCAKQFALLREQPSLRTPEFFLESLKEVKGLLMKDLQISKVWTHLAPTRKKLVGLLNSENRGIIEEISRRTPDILLLYGNNLFIAVLVALGENNLTTAERLWSSIVEWMFYQLGMDIQDNEVKWVYSFQVILSQLMTRANALSHSKTLEKTPVQEQIGAIIWEQSGYKSNAMLLIPQDEGFLTAYIEGLRERFIPPKWHKCKTRPQRLKTFALESLSSPDRLPILSTTVQDSQVLWFPLYDEYQGLVWASCILEHGKPGGRNNIVPWFKLTPTTSGTISFIPPDTLPSIPDSVDSALKKLARIKHTQVPVNVSVNVNQDEEVFEVNLSGDKIDENLEFTRTDDLVRFLRHNISSGIGYLMDGQELVWELQDIEFADEDLSFLKPLVYRSRFYPDEFHYPKTCGELVASTTGKKITMVVEREDKNYRVEFEDLPEGSTLKNLEEVTFDIFALGLLTECEKLYNVKGNVWYPVELDVTPIMDISFSRIHEYPRLNEAVRTADTSKFDWTRRNWKLKGEYRSKLDEITWWIESNETGIWRKNVFTFVVDWDHPPEETMKYFREEISSVVTVELLDGVNETLESLKSTTKERYQSYWQREREFKQKKMELHEGQVCSYSQIEYRDDVVWIALESDKGEEEEDIVRDVWKLKDDAEFAGAISPERISSQVIDVLSPYEFEKDVLDEIIEKAKKILWGEGVRFLEE